MKRALRSGIVFILVSIVGTFSVYAIEQYGNPNLSCTGIVGGTAFGVFYSRDNTGANQESYQMQVFDGSGTLILESAISTVPSGMAQSWTNSSALYTTSPAYNPIRFEIVSFAGNGLPEQRIVAGTYNCPSLPTYQTEVLSAGFRATDGRINQDAFASASVYCIADGIEIWAIDSAGTGSFVTRVSNDAINAIGTNLTENGLITSAQGPRGEVQLWRLTTGQFMLTSPGQAGDDSKTYQYVWAGCS